ncbi:SCO family protein [Pseudomonas sp. UBA6323]|uniref:SCO family protein n=1 Tax=Pseudomonas sp. UBA6323 TaxID=1947329 RepID=UPI0025E2A30D|nr:SCO family protein [Pseudomonas sp. UBA6323]
MRRSLWGTAICIGLLLAGLPLAYRFWPAAVPPAALVGEVAGAFELVDHQGRLLDQNSFAERWLLLSFGFTHCPDVCPTTLATVAKTLDKLGPSSQHVQPLFITLDPERDSPQLLQRYTGFFDPRILGLSGSVGQVMQAADAYGVYVSRREGSGTYLLDHTTSLYLVAPDGRLVELFAQNVTPEHLASSIGDYLDAD